MMMPHLLKLKDSSFRIRKVGSILFTSHKEVFPTWTIRLMNNFSVQLLRQYCML